MFTQVEAARSLARRVAIYNATNPPLVQYSIASKTFCTTTAFEVASEALQIFGGNGLTREYPIEKLLRDARVDDRGRLQRGAEHRRRVAPLTNARRIDGAP